uniref:uncharacterized protein isoform X2 n=1 Tax=Myxine glutinosa TaxID=7769 RepID=UPI00358DDBC2
MFNSCARRRKSTGSVQSTKHSHNRETPVPVYLGVMMHTKTRRRDLVDELYRLGVSIAYDRVLSISSELGNNICRYFMLEGAVCPPKLKGGLFTTGAVDNIDHNPSSTSAQDSFHGTGISLFQHPNSDVPGVQRIVDTDNTATTATTVSHLPESYTSVPPVLLSKRDPPIPKLAGPNRSECHLIPQAVKTEYRLMMYAVVHFHSSNEVGVIPCMWLCDNNKYCLWPTNMSSTQVIEAIKGQHKTQENWMKYRIRILQETETYEKGKQMSQTVVYGSGLNKTDDDAIAQKRKYTSDEADYKQPVKSIKAETVIGTSPPKSLPAFVTQSSSNDAMQPPRVPATAETSFSGFTDFGTNLSSPAGGTTCDSMQSILSNISDKDKIILTVLEEIKRHVKQHTVMLQTILERQQPQDVEWSTMHKFNFPLKTMEDVQMVEELLADNATERALVMHLSKLGGMTQDDVVRRILCHVVSNKIATQFNWMGRGSKSAFSELALTRAIKAAAKKASVNEAQCEAKIKSWLKYSGDRDGGRKSREAYMEGARTMIIIDEPLSDAPSDGDADDKY